MFASVVSNDEILKRSHKDDALQVVKPDSGEVQDFKLAPITDLDDVYKIGAICHIQAQHDPNNLFMPYYMNLIATEKAEVISLATTEDHRVYPLCNVVVQKIQEEVVKAKDLSENDAVIFKFLTDKFK